MRRTEWFRRHGGCPSKAPGALIRTHEWVAGQKWDRIVTMDDATNEHYSMFFVELVQATRADFVLHVFVFLRCERVIKSNAGVKRRRSRPP